MRSPKSVSSLSVGKGEVVVIIGPSGSGKLSKMDGDTRGGAALSIKKMTGVPICFIGVGEKLPDIELFHPDRMASRILGMGDVVSLVEKAQQVIDEKDAKDLKKKILNNTFDLNDFLNQLRTIKKLGRIKDILSLIPGLNKLPIDQIDEKELVYVEAVLSSMTPKTGNRMAQYQNESGLQQIHRQLEQSRHSSRGRPVQG